MLISETTFSSLAHPERYLTRNLGKVRVKGKNEPVTVYEVLDPLEYKMKALRIKTKDVFEKGILLYQNRKFAEALVKFDKIIAVDEHDKAVLMYRQSAAGLKDKDISGVEWDGTIEMLEK